MYYNARFEPESGGKPGIVAMMARGPHPTDLELFAQGQIQALQQAVGDLSWLLGRGYAGPSSLKLVGDRYRLRERQRRSVRSGACSDAALRRRQQTKTSLATLVGPLAVDGFNCVITLEVALAGGVVLRGRDGALRDLASVHGSYRRAEVTMRAIDALAQTLRECAATPVTWYLDRPVSNSGRLRQWLLEAEPQWTVELPYDADQAVMESGTALASADAKILDAAEHGWVDLVAETLSRMGHHAWIVELGTTTTADRA